MASVEASLPQFERFVIERDHERALLAALTILQAIDGRYGRIDRVAIGSNDSALARDEAMRVFCTRFASAFGQMIAAPDFALSGVGYEALLVQRQWLDVIFSLSGFRGSDHLLTLVGQQDQDGNLSYRGNRLVKMLAVRSVDSRATLDLDQAWRANRDAAALAFLHSLDSLCVPSARGGKFRDAILEWLPERIDEVRLGPLTLSNIQNAYLHCSYASTPNKHAIKAGLIRQMRRHCLEAGCKEFAGGVSREPRPTVVVVLERFGRSHSVYRTHWLALRSLRERFNVVWVGYASQIDSQFQEAHDELIPIPLGELFAGIRTVADEILRRAPALVLHVGVGMSAASIALASLRLAPVQCVSFGHTATTMSPAIDAMILPEDIVGDPGCFSERVVALPRQAMPFMPPPVRGTPAPAKTGNGTVQVAVVASAMKLNAGFIDALKRIAAAAKTPVEFHVFPAFAVGLTHRVLAGAFRRELPMAVVHAETPYAKFLERLAGCDLFLCPFPYGNMNSIVDTASVGLPGVCLDGREAHAHADAGFFARIGLPPELVARTVEEYVACAARLIDDAPWRAACRQAVAGCDLGQAFYDGDASFFCSAIADLIGSGGASRLGESL
jgi:hypothetical protein